ncbi:MAG: prolyl oligopeptidase family serine peptidase, partial [Tannerellaceae bacterium]|nr:prolyl oligopeptidase family serine peptidase [Tannerellaceae bacterium]
MSFEQLIAWERITEQAISDNGEWVACKMEPWRGASKVLIYNKKGEQLAEIPVGSKLFFTSSSNYLLLTQSPALELVEEAKLKKIKEEEMPANKLIIYKLATKQAESIDSVKSYKYPETADWLAYQRTPKNDSALYIRSCDGSAPVVIPNVSDYNFAKKENILYYITTEKSADNQTISQLVTFTPEKGSSVIHEGKGVFKQVAFTEKGDQLAFLYCPDKDSTATGFSLYLSEKNQPARLVATRENNNIPSGWVVSEHAAITFSKNGERVYFGTSPEPLQKDTTILPENRPNVQVWKWDEGVQYTVQNVNKSKDLNRSYKAVYNTTKDQIVQLATENIPEVITPEENASPWAILSTSKPYDTQRMWRGKNKYDIYVVNLDNGEKQQIMDDVFHQIQLSPQGKFAYWYNIADSSWYTYNLAEKKEYRLTTPTTFYAWDEDNDVPDYPRPHGLAGWSKEDKEILIYDRYDIWKFDPENKTQPVNLTVNGRTNRISYRYAKLDKEEKAITLNQEQILRGFNEQTKGYGYYNTKFSNASQPKQLIGGDFMLRTLVKAQKTDKVIYSCETFETYPDLYLSDIRFSKSVKLTEGDKQQEQINWGTAELISWTSLDGQLLEGVIYKPENFDPDKKYPMVVNFYERNADTFHNYRMPEPHRSTLDYHFYTSNGYIIFNPDIRYKDGYPGESCFNAVMPGISKVLEGGYVNEKAIGAQGHSWGGYQVAYLATRTNLFAAIESGAPVVNMLSAYGGIRWETGLNRSFQYEHGQSRIGGTIWEKPLAYMENSPIFTMDKVNTPILIMHNDNDGHVPWYQGIEYFVALKRLQKPVWMLNYPGEVHWPLRMINRIDFQKRMFQFFEHYLNGKPMPKWMEEGVPA